MHLKTPLALHVAQIRMVNIRKKIVNADEELTYTARGQAKQEPLCK